MAPAWNVPERPDEISLRRLVDVFGPDGVLPTSDQVPCPLEHLEPSRIPRIPSKVWLSLILGLFWGFASWMIPGWTIAALPWWARLLLPAAGYIAGLILGIWGRAEAGASDRPGAILGILAIGLNAYRLAWTVIAAIQYGVVVRG